MSYCVVGNFLFADLLHTFASVSFQASRSTTLSPGAGVVQFDQAMTVDHWSFNKQNSSFTAPASGYYWLHMTSAIPSGMMTDMRMVGANRSVGIASNHTSFTGGAITASADTVIYLTSGTNIHVSSSYTLYSDTMLQTSFGGFLLDSIMSPVVAFAVGLSATFSTVSSNVPFDIIYEDTNRAWNATTSEYVVPVAGVYALSTLTTAAASSQSIAAAASKWPGDHVALVHG
jgi:hypothetical protein